jgi:hypothetical protein
MLVEDFLSRLEGVKKAKERSWNARCPAHKDRSPSLRVTDTDGVILIHCFAGCSPGDIASAAGVNLSDLFPPRNEHERLAYRRERLTRAMLAELRRELQVALIILGDVENRQQLDPEHHIARANRAARTLRKLMREVEGATRP